MYVPVGIPINHTEIFVIPRGTVNDGVVFGEAAGHEVDFPVFVRPPEILLRQGQHGRRSIFDNERPVITVHLVPSYPETAVGGYVGNTNRSGIHTGNFQDIIILFIHIEYLYAAVSLYSIQNSGIGHANDRSQEYE